MKLTRNIIIFGIACAIVGAVLTLAIGILTYHPTPVSEQVKTIVKTDVRVDTITIRDTIPVDRIVPRYTEVVKRDTIKADTVLLVERKGYNIPVANDSINGEIYASVSGVNPSLDSLSYRFDIPEKTITERIEVEKIITKKTHINYGVGVMAGYSIFSKRPDICAGLYIGYSF